MSYCNSSYLEIRPKSGAFSNDSNPMYVSQPGEHGGITQINRAKFFKKFEIDSNICSEDRALWRHIRSFTRDVYDICDIHAELDLLVFPLTPSLSNAVNKVCLGVATLTV